MHMIRWFSSGVLAALLFAGAACAQEQVPVVAQSARVMDTAHMLQPQQRAQLEQSLSQFEQAHGTQIAILTLPSTSPETIEQYGIRVGDAWKSGRKKVDDGVILIVAPNNPHELGRLRLEVGYGLEGAITDPIAKRILVEDVAPAFGQGDYFGGMVKAVADLERVINKEGLAPAARSGHRQGSIPGILVILGALVFFVLWGLLRAGSATYLPGTRGLNSGMWLPLYIGSSLLSGGFRSGGSSGSDFGGGGGGGFGGGGASGDW
jgi:uncharacterized protein